MTHPKLLKATNLTKSYGKTTILHGVSLSVRAGEFLAIVGPSGSGKSTLLHILGCVEQADSGELEICGKNVQKQSSAQLAELRGHELGFVFQFFYFQPHLTVGKNLEVPMMPLHTKVKERQARIEAAAGLVGIVNEGRRNHVLFLHLPKAIITPSKIWEASSKSKALYFTPASLFINSARNFPS